MYDPISEKFCNCNLKVLIDTDKHETHMIIIDINDEEYHIILPHDNYAKGDLFEIANDFAKSIVINTYADINEYF